MRMKLEQLERPLRRGERSEETTERGGNEESEISESIGAGPERSDGRYSESGESGKKGRRMRNLKHRKRWKWLRRRP